MFDLVLKALFGTKNDREIKQLQPVVDEINALEPTVRKLSDAQASRENR